MKFIIWIQLFMIDMYVSCVCMKGFVEVEELINWQVFRTRCRRVQIDKLNKTFTKWPKHFLKLWQLHVWERWSSAHLHYCVFNFHVILLFYSRTKLVVLLIERRSGIIWIAFKYTHWSSNLWRTNDYRIWSSVRVLSSLFAQKSADTESCSCECGRCTIQITKSIGCQKDPVPTYVKNILVKPWTEV